MGKVLSLVGRLKIYLDLTQVWYLPIYNYLLKGVTSLELLYPVGYPVDAMSIDTQGVCYNLIAVGCQTTQGLASDEAVGGARANP